MWSGIKSVVNKIFGAGSSTTLSKPVTKPIVVGVKSVATVSATNKSKTVVSKTGNTNKPISVYNNNDNGNPSVGLKLNAFSINATLNLSWSDISLSFGATIKNNYYSLNAGIEPSNGFNLYAGATVGSESANISMESDYRLNVNPLVPIAIWCLANGYDPSPYMKQQYAY